MKSLNSYLPHFNSGAPVSESVIRESLESLIDGENSEAEMEHYLRALSTCAIDEHWLFHAASLLRERCVSVDLQGLPAIDNCGTGGDQSGAFNFSTASALLASCCEVPMAKHGNRAITSRSGSADLLEALEIPTDLPPEEVLPVLRQEGFAFMLAPRYHPALAKVQALRRRLGLVTVFNYLGPLLNPARVPYQVIGIAKSELRSEYAKAVRRLGTTKTWVLWGEGGLDEMSLCGKTFVSEVTAEGIEEKVFEPQEAALRVCEKKHLVGGDAAENAKILQGIFDKNFFGPLVHGILWNAAAVLHVQGRAESLKEGVREARLAIENGLAAEKLNRLKRR